MTKEQKQVKPGEGTFSEGERSATVPDAADEQGKWAVGSDVIMEFIRRGS